MCLEPLSLATTAEWGSFRVVDQGIVNVHFSWTVHKCMVLGLPWLGIIWPNQYPISWGFLAKDGKRPPGGRGRAWPEPKLWVLVKDFLLPLSSLFWYFSSILKYLLLGMARHTYTHPLFPFSFSLPCSPQQVLSQTVLEQSFCLSLLGAPQCELLCLAEGSSLVVRGREGEDQCLLPHL